MKYRIDGVKIKEESVPIQLDGKNQNSAITIIVVILDTNAVHHNIKCATKSKSVVHFILKKRYEIGHRYGRWEFWHSLHF